MNRTNSQTLEARAQLDQLLAELDWVVKVVLQARSSAEGNGLTPGTCAFVDGRLANAMTHLATARSIAITAGSSIDLEGSAEKQVMAEMLLNESETPTSEATAEGGVA